MLILNLEKLSQTVRNFQEINDSGYKKNSNLGDYLQELKTLYFFVDEFTNLLDTKIGLDAIALLQGLNYELKFVKHEESGRPFISKGFLDQAKNCATKNVNIFKNLITENTPLIGVEPSAILGFRDEYIRLADDKASAEKIAKNSKIS